MCFVDQLFRSIHEYVPALAKIPSLLIPWVNVIGYGLAKFAVPDAQAGISDAIPDAFGVLICGFTNAVWARQLYEGFGRGLLESWLKVKKAVPR